MLVTHEREKLIHAINYFARNTKKLGKVKLFKLLYFLDFEHFKQTGRNVTGLTYFAWPMGPVPVSLHNEIVQPKDDMTEALELGKRDISDGWMLVVNPKIPFSDRHFTKREIAILEHLAAEYRDADADSMIEATHLENLPWDQIYNKDGKKQQEIPYELALRLDEREQMMKIARDRAELLEKLM
ncbi:Panacea domain-containing protein [Rhodopseudomonas palustris]|uniref:Antitoxin SocA-like Panacea domain-containing protein n=1 Tax=Rhodopseudomonas palustris (strain BisB18) TaxID=316056 RepID=Q20XC4_RHOPB